MRVLAGQTGDGKNEEASDRAKPAHGRGDMRGEHELLQAGWHDHGMWPPMPSNTRCWMRNNRTSTTMRIVPNTFTQRGVRYVEERSSPMLVLSPLSLSLSG